MFFEIYTGQSKSHLSTYQCDIAVIWARWWLALGILDNLR